MASVLRSISGEARSSISSAGSALLSTVMGSKSDSLDLGVRKALIQSGLTKSFEARERLEREGLATVEVGEGDKLALPPGSVAEVVQATYGPVDDSGEHVDVLETIKQDILKGNPLPVNNSTMGKDPMPGVRKVCKVLYKPVSEPLVVEVAEGKQLDIPSHALEGIVSATYGHGNDVTDVLVPLQAALFDTNGRGITVSNELLGVDPAPGKTKTLTVTSMPSRTRLEFKLPTTKEPAHFSVVAPWLFHELCSAVGVELKELCESLTSEDLKGGEKQVSGKSGEIFWFSSDNRFVLKTISDQEVATLVRMLPECTAYLKTNPDSLLTRYLGVFSMSDNGLDTQFVIMNNVFEGAPSLDVMYDLKGTTEDRWVDPEPGKCLKDNNFAMNTLFFSDEEALALHRAIAADTRFLQKQGIMDYSMMAAMVYEPPAGFEPLRRYSKLMGGLQARETSGVLDTGLKECIVFIGMVDMLVTYGWKKVAAHIIKSSTIGWATNEIDTVAPDRYATRFRGNFAKKFLGKSEECSVTEVSPDKFVTPMPALGRSGGTAAFFKASYKEGASEEGTTDYWLAKDLARARDEVDFYEKSKALQDKPGWELLKYMTPYKGVCKAPCEVEDGKEPKTTEVMLLRNCRDDYSTCRMLDIKIGQVTAVGGWQNKGSFEAWVQVNTVDANTNSDREGFRLEGFDSPPPSLVSIETLLATGVATKVALSEKKVKRLNLQRYTAIEFLSFFLDVHDCSSSTFAKRSDSWKPAPADRSAGTEELLSTSELQEIVLLNCIEQLAGLVKACREAQAPQQWIGSSVMLAFDCDARPRRDEVLGRGSPWGLARVHIFDWGRSELNTPALHERLEEDAQAEREKYWGFYRGGVAKLFYECCRLYLLRFWHTKRSIFLSVWDKDQYTADDFIGRCELPLEETGGEQVLSSFAGKDVTSGFLRGTKAKLGLSLKPRPLPEGTRFAECWTVRVHHAENLPAKDLSSDNDVFVEVTGLDVPPSDLANLSDTSRQQLVRDAAQITSLAVDAKDPVFEEDFEIATLAESARSGLLNALAVAWGMEGASSEALEKELSDFFSSELERAPAREDQASLQESFAQKCFPGK